MYGDLGTGPQQVPDCIAGGVETAVGGGGGVGSTMATDE